jgi:hypothetical protein
MTRFLLTSLIALFFNCANHGQLIHVAELPEKLNENSGILYLSGKTAWFIEDNGNSDNLYQVNFNGVSIKKFEVKNAKNHDWEDLTSDKNKNVYIGDFGNNTNDRKNLVIYKLPNPEVEPGNKIDAERIAFNYPEQKDFPPKKGLLFYDSEAFFHFEGHLYVFTKNRANPFNGEAFIYKIPDVKGTHEAQQIGTIKTCSDWNTCKITSAAISPDSKTIVLLGNGKLWTITDFSGDAFHSGTMKEIDLGVRTQLESVCFMNDSVLLLSDEVRAGTGGNLYSYSLN